MICAINWHKIKLEKRSGWNSNNWKFQWFSNYPYQKTRIYISIQIYLHHLFFQDHAFQVIQKDQHAGKIMSTVTIEPLIHHSLRRTPKFYLTHRKPSSTSVNYTRRPFSVGAARLSFCSCKHRPRRKALAVRASSTVIETSDVVFEETFDLKRPHRVSVEIHLV